MNRSMRRCVLNVIKTLRARKIILLMSTTSSSSDPVHVMPSGPYKQLVNVNVNQFYSELTLWLFYVDINT